MKTEIWIQAIILLFLCVMSVEDWHTRSVSAWKVLLFTGVLLLCAIVKLVTSAENIETKLGETFMGMIPGILLLLAGKAAKGAVGPADGWVILGIGAFWGFWKTAVILWFAFVGAALTALFLLIVKKKGRKYEIPFFPFLVIGMLGGLCCG